MTRPLVSLAERSALFRQAITETRSRFAVSAVAERVGVKLKRAGHEWVACCPFHPDNTPSFTVFADDRRFHCFGCGVGGDVLDFVQRAYSISLFDAIELLDAGVLGELAHPRPAPRPKCDTRAAADRIAKGSLPIEGTPAETYLRSRGITMPLPHTLRFARLPAPKDSGVAEASGPGLLPALVAIVTDPAGALVGVQRTYLTEAGRKAATSDRKGTVKFSLGHLAGNAMQLAPPAETLIVCEGLEDGLTLAQELGVPVWVAAGTSMLRRMTFADCTRSIVIGADGDEPGERAAQEAARAFAGAGLAVRIMRPSPGFKDANAELMGVRS